MKFLLKGIGLLLILHALNANSQESYNQIDALSNLEVLGTSSLHDWEIEGEKLSGQCTAQFKDGKISSVDKLSFVVEVSGLESGKSGMDKNTQKALNYEQHKNITYKLKSVERIAPSKDGKNMVLTTKGVLSIAGFEKELEMKVAGRKLSNGSVQFLGKTTFNMTDYKVDPPTAMMGSIKTGDEVEVKFQIIYSNN